MKMVRVVCVAVIASFVIAALPKTTWAESTGSPVSVDLRAAINRAAAQSVAEARDTSSPFSGSRPAARAKQSMGGGGGSMMMVWTVVGTLTGLATTYFVVKEMRKQTDRAAEGQ
jgi:hypothetical protein